MANNLKFDIGSTVRQVSELNKSLEALGQIAQGLFSNLGRLSDTFGSKVTSAASSVQSATGIGPADMLTHTGQMEASEAIRNEVKRAQIKAAMAGNNGQYITTGTGEIKEKMTSAAGTAFRATGFTKDSLYAQSATSALQNAAEGVASSAQNAQNAIASNPSIPAQAKASILRSGGYSIADMPRMINSSGQVGDVSNSISQTIDKLNKSNIESNRQVAMVLEKIKTELAESNKGFLSAVENFASASKLGPESNEYRDSQKRLIDAMKQLEMATEDAATVQRDSANMAGGGGGGGGGFLSKFGGGGQFAMRAAGIIGGAAGIGLGAYNVAQSMDLGYRRAAFGADLDTAKAQGAIGQSLYQQSLGAYDMTTAENLMKYRANQLFPGTRFEYLGQQGYANSLQNAAQMVKETRDIQRLERQRDLVNTGVSGAAGVLGGAAAGALAGSVIPGIGTAIGGIIGGIGGGLAYGLPKLTQGIDQYYSSPYTSYSGGAGKARMLAEQMKDQASVLDYADQFREAELKRRSIETATIHDILQTKSAMREGGFLVGQYSVGMDTYQGKRFSASGVQNTASAMMSPDSVFADNVGQRIRYAETRAGRASGGLKGGYNETNPTTGAHGAYQVIDKYWKEVAEGMYGIKPSDMNPEQQEGFFRKALLPSHRAAAQRIAKKYPIAGRLEPEVLTGLMQLGEGNVGKYFASAGLNDPTGGQIAGYVKALKEAPVRSSIAASELSVDINEVAATNMPWTRFGISQGDYIRRRNQLTNVLGSGVVASDAQTSRIMQYQYGGLGSMESMMGSLANINQISGGQNNTRRLEQVLVTAVSQGFDKSRMSQQFVQTTVELARGLNLQNIGAAAKSIGAQAGLSSGTIGTATERSLALAAQGIRDYGAFSAQSGGLIGALKVQSAYGSGASVGRGGNLLQGRSVEEAGNMLTELRTSGANTQNEALQDLITLSGGVEQAEKALQSQVSGGAQNAFRGMFNLVASTRGTSYDEMLSGLRKSSGKERTKAIGTMRAIARSTAQGLGISEEGAIRALGIDLEQGGFISAKENKAQFEGALARGQARSIDPAEVLKRKVVDNLVTQYVSDPTRKVGIKQYEEYLQAQGSPVSIMSGLDGAGTAITPELLAKSKGDPALKKSIEQTLGAMSPVDLAQGTLQSATSTGEEQKVFITNFSSLALEMVRMGMFQNEKKIK